MEKQITIFDNEGMASKAWNLYGAIDNVAQSASGKLRAPLRWLRRYYSTVLDRPVSMAQARLLTNTQAAFFLVALPADYPVLLRIAACAWFIASLLRCRDAL